MPPSTKQKKSQSDYLRRHGLRTSPQELEELIRHAVERLGRSHSYEDPAREFTREELNALKRGGFSMKPPLQGDPLALGVADYVALLQTALTTEAAAARLKVDPSRIRQRLTGHPRSLYGIKVRGEWRLPVFQFEGHHTVNNIEEIVAVLDESLHPITVFRWFTTSHPDLASDELEGKQACSPLEWLRLGFPVGPVLALAREL